MFNLGITEIALVLVVALIFIGPKMLPEIASGLGKIIREIRKTTSDIRQDIELDDMIRGPLRELREAATLPPEELKRRDEAKAARRKAEEEAEERRRQAAQAAGAQEQQRRPSEAAAEVRQREMEAQATQVSLAVPPLAAPPEVASTGGTMLTSPPPTPDDLRTLTPVPALVPPPLPPPLPPSPGKAEAPAEATVIDLQAQLKATLEGKATPPGRTAPAPLKPPLYRPRGDKKE